MHQHNFVDVLLMAKKQTRKVKPRAAPEPAQPLPTAIAIVREIHQAAPAEPKPQINALGIRQTDPLIPREW